VNVIAPYYKAVAATAVPFLGSVIMQHPHRNNRR